MAFQTITPIFILRVFIPYIKEANKKCEMLITERKEEMEQLRSENFDPIPEHTASVLGLPYPTSYVPGLTLSGYSDKMSISERFFNLFFQMAGYYLSFEVYDSLTLIMRKHFGSNYPDIRQIIKDSPLILVNADEFVDFPRPLFSNIIYIGGIGMNEKEQEDSNQLSV
uniref:glucuronosyltransferase n=1 Tax=Meloidogyne javanica TaxID=6303 RepID=A0A915LVM3_MELJA